MSKHISYAVLGVVTAAMLLGGVTVLTMGSTPAPKAPTSFSVTVARPKLGRIAETLSVTGMIVPREEIQVRSELSGVRVLDVLADVGASVRKGQKLAVLDGDSLTYQLLPLQSDYERAKDAFTRVDGLKESGAVSKQLVQEKRAEMQAAKAKLDNAALNLKRTSILAPEAGVIFERKAVIGGLVTDSEPLFRIARHHEIEMEAQVPEAMLSSLRSGQTAAITLSGESVSMEGVVRLVAPRVDRTTRMAAIRIQLQGAPAVPIGLFTTARIVLSEHEGMLLPKAAIHGDGGGDFVWIVNAADEATRWPVKVVQTDGTQALIKTLPFYLRVVARAGTFLREGDRVRAVEGQ